MQAKSENVGQIWKTKMLFSLTAMANNESSCFAKVSSLFTQIFKNTKVHEIFFARGIFAKNNKSGDIAISLLINTEVLIT